MKNKKQKGFTLVEMMVVATIVTIVIGTILGSQSRYSDKLNLKNQAYNLALKLRQAQVNSMGVVSNSVSPQNFNVSYGVSFVQLPSNTYANYFLYYIDRDFDGRYDDTNSSDTLLETVTFGSGVTVKSLCGRNNSGIEDCVTPQLRNIDIVFRRPNPVASLRFSTNGGASVGLSAPARIELQSVSGANTMSIIIDSTGQVSVQ